MKPSRTRLSALGILLAGWAVAAGCGGPGDVPPASSSKPPVSVTETELVEPLTCADLETQGEWDARRCETGGNDACGGVGEATADCAHCCPAPLPSSVELATERGWAAVACEKSGDGSCYGLGEATSDCDVACEAPSPPSTCAAVAAEWGFEQAVCETQGNNACGGKGIATSDCARCCDVADPAESEDVANFGDDMAEVDDAEIGDEDEPSPPPGEEYDAQDFADVVDEAPAGPPAQPPPASPPPPGLTCGEIATQNGWGNGLCETSSNHACGGVGVPSADCKLCCEGAGGETGPVASKKAGTLNVVTYNLAGATRAQLNALAKALRKEAPTVIGLQEATRAQMNFIGDRLGSKKAAFKRRSFARTRTEGKQDVGVAIVSKLPLDDVRVTILGDGEKLLRAEVSTPRGPFLFGSAWVRDGKGALVFTRLTQKMGKGHALLALSFDGGPLEPGLGALAQKLTDGWSDGFGEGATNDDRRHDFLLRGSRWLPAVAGQTLGATGGKRRRAVVQSYDPSTLTDDEPSGGGETIGGIKVRVASYNIRTGSADRGTIRSWDARRAQAIQVFQDLDADFIGVQEARIFQLRDIDARVKKQYARFGISRGGPRDEYSAIYYRKKRFRLKERETYWLSDTPDKRSGSSFGDKWPRIVTWGRFEEKDSGYQLYHYNTHWGLTDNSAEKSARLMIRRIEARTLDLPFFLTGDLNTREGEAPVRFLKGNEKLDGVANPLPLTDTFRELKGDAPGCTAHGYRYCTTDGAKIDYVLVNGKKPDVSGAEIVRTHDGNRYPSDHYPIWGAVKLPDQKKP